MATYTPNTHERHCTHGYPVCPHEYHLDHIHGRSQSTIHPYLHRIPQTRFYKGPVGLVHPNFNGHTHILFGMFSCRTSTALKTTQVHYVCPCLGNTHCNGTNACGHRDLYRDLGMGVGGLEFSNHLGKVLNRVDVVLIRWRDESDSRLTVPGLSHPLRDLGAW